MLHAAEQLVTMKEWLDVTLRRNSKQHPLAVRDLSATLYTCIAPDHRVVFVDDNTSTPQDWTELQPAVVQPSSRGACEAEPRDVLIGLGAVIACRR